MKAVKARITRALLRGARVPVCDNSGAKIINIISVINLKTVRRRVQSAAVGDLITASVVSGNVEMRKQVVYAIIVRQRKEYRRPDGTRIKFEDNAAVVLKDEKGTPKGTLFKGPIAKEASYRWQSLAKVAGMIV